MPFATSRSLKQAEDLGIVVIGWHATEFVGGNPEIGSVHQYHDRPTGCRRSCCALLAIVNSNGQAKTVVFTDPNYEIAMIKANAMVETIKRCAVHAMSLSCTIYP